MIKGLLIYAEADAKRNEWFINELIEEGKSLELDIELIYSEQLIVYDVDEVAKSYQFAIMRDRNYLISQSLEENGIVVFNSSEISRLGNDKWEAYCYYKDKVPMMYTQKTKLPFPFVMKTKSGHGGSEVFYIKDANSYDKAMFKLKVEGFSEDDLIYQMVATDTGKDLRVYVLGDYVMASMLRVSQEDFRANISLGGTATYKELSDAEMRIVARVSEELNKGFYGIDIIYNKETPVLNEIEDVVGSRMLYQYTDINVAREYMLWMKKELMKKEILND